MMAYPPGFMLTSAALAESDRRGAYIDGMNDAVLLLLAPVCGFPPPADVAPGLDGEAHRILGSRFKISVEWLDSPRVDLLGRMVARARDRAKEMGRY